jgi:hypothetical protein
MLALLFCAALPASAQIRRQTPFGPPPQVDPATVAMPDLAFTPTPEVAENFDKYFYFNRADTDFMTAYADLRECDGYARGLAFHSQYSYGQGVVGDMLAGAIADAIFGSAERRRQRRLNMLTCMRFKDYRVFGLPENLWERFNFEEGSRRVPEAERQRMLQMQAKVASGPAPTVGEVTQ